MPARLSSGLPERRPGALWSNAALTTRSTVLAWATSVTTASVTVRPVSFVETTVLAWATSVTTASVTVRP
ncbi:MAG: hypothetical protein ACPH04_07030, partial [Candidatus Poseidoniaceae archaeon]